MAPYTVNSAATSEHNGALKVLRRFKKWKTLTGAPLWRTGDKGAPPLPQTLAVRKQLQKKT